MIVEKNTQKVFIGFTFIWSFVFWGLGIYLAMTQDITLLENADLFNALLNKTLTSDFYTITLLNTLAGYGPLFGAVFVTIFTPENRKYFKKKFKVKTPFKYILQIIALFVIITVIPIISLALNDGLVIPLTGTLAKFLLLFFIYQLITAGTEEIG